MFYFLEDFDIANYADDSTQYCAEKSVDFVVSILELHQVNNDQSRLSLLRNSRISTTIENSYTESEDEQVLLAITNDADLTFEKHINIICKKAS